MRERGRGPTLRAKAKGEEREKEEKNEGERRERRRKKREKGRRLGEQPREKWKQASVSKGEEEGRKKR